MRGHKKISDNIFVSGGPIFCKFQTTDIKLEMLSGVQTGNGTPHDKYSINGIAYARTNRKYDIFRKRRLVHNFTYILEWGRGTCTLTKHIRRLTYSALRYFCLISQKPRGIFPHNFLPPKTETNKQISNENHFCSILGD